MRGSQPCDRVLAEAGTLVGSGNQSEKAPWTFIHPCIVSVTGAQD